MNIKIIEPYDFNRRYDVSSLTPGLGPPVIATLLRQAGHEVEVLSEYVTKLRIEDIHEADLVGISITTYNANRGYKIAQRLEKQIVFGGFHASLMPEECLRYGNYVIRGDGHSIVDLADCLRDGNTKSLNQIPNLVYQKDGEIFYNKTEKKPINVVPDFSLVKDYYKFNRNRLLRIPLLVYASRGCPYDCSFCSVKEVYNGFLEKDKEIIIEDVKSQLKNQHFLSRFLPKIIWLVDDNFFSDRKWAKDVLRELAKLKTRYQFNIQARPEIAHDDELLKLMKRARVGFVSLGIESLNKNSLVAFEKQSSIEDIKYAVKRIRNFGMDVYGLFIFGDDEFRKGDGLKVADFAKAYQLAGLLIQPLTPFPGTKLFDKLKKEGRLLHENWHDYNGKVVFRPKKLTAVELQKEIYDCYRNMNSVLGLVKYLLLGKWGFRLIMLGIAVFRYLEWLKCRNYIKDKL